MSTAAFFVAALALAGVETTDDMRWIVASVANVRQAPLADAPLVGKLGIGAKVIVRGCAQQFCRVEAARAGGMSGYVAESLLGRAPPNYPALMAEAMRSLERACALSPNDRDCLVALEAAYRAGGKPDAAERVASVLERRQSKGQPSSAGSGGPRLHDVGTHHGDEALAKDGEEWFALCDGKFRAVKVSVRPVLDALLDEEGGAMTGRAVGAPCEASVLLKGIHGFSPKDVRFARQHDDGSFALGGQRIALRNEQGHAVFVDVKTKKRQRLGPFDAEGGEPVVVFAGDLDGDGHLDFIANYSEHYNVSALHLFLSSAADGWAPREVHEHRDTGC